MQSYGETDALRGWGQMLPALAAGGKLCVTQRRGDCAFSQERRYVLPELVIDNCAMGGRSSRSFAEENRLADIEAHLQCGDFLLVQFLHNDADPAHPERYVTAAQFSECLRRYAGTARRKGAQMILATPVPWLVHTDAAGYPPAYTEYLDAMEALAREEDIPCLELGRAFAAACGQLGPRRAAALYQPDGVHLTALGAERVAEEFVHLLRSGTDRRLALLRTVFTGA